MLTALMAWHEGEPEPAATFSGDRVVEISGADGASWTVSFDPKRQADIVIDVAAVRRHAAATDPVRD